MSFNNSRTIPSSSSSKPSSWAARGQQQSFHNNDREDNKLDDYTRLNPRVDDPRPPTAELKNLSNARNRPIRQKVDKENHRNVEQSHRL